MNCSSTVSYAERQSPWVMTELESVNKQVQCIDKMLDTNRALITLLHGYADGSIELDNDLVIKRLVKKAEELNTELLELLDLQRKAVPKK